MQSAPDSAYRRPKQPQIVRRALIEQAARLAVEEGLAAVTVQAVADAVGVTKGGVTHHFPHKRALIDAVVGDLLDALDAEINAWMMADPEPHGAFTRAYLEATLAAGADVGNPWGSLAALMLADASLRARWSGWLAGRLARHHATDNDRSLAIVRLAADGLWLADLGGVELGDRKGLRARLLAMTRRGS